MKSNRGQVKETVSPGKNIKLRIDLPKDVGCYSYANQKKNIYEMQKEQMRKIISEDKQNYYTYSNDFLGGAFPIVNENTQIAQAKAECISRWITPKGFDNLHKRMNWNEHPKRPDLAKLDDLRYPLV